MVNKQHLEYPIERRPLIVKVKAKSASVGGGGTSMSMISVTLPDGSVNEYASGITAGEIVIDIEGRKHDCVAAFVDGEQKDFSSELSSDCSVAGISGFSKEGMHILRHSAAHLLAQAVTSLSKCKAYNWSSDRSRILL